MAQNVLHLNDIDILTTEHRLRKRAPCRKYEISGEENFGIASV